MSGTGGIDASIALQARPPAAPNPLQQIGEYANAANSINQLRLFPGQQQLQQQAIQGGGVSLAQKINQAVYQGLTPMLATPNGQITHQSYTDALAGLEARGLPTHGALADLLKTAPVGDGPAFDQMVRSRIASQAMVSPESSVSQITGTPADVSNGQVVSSGVRAPMYRGGGFTSGSSVQMQPSPETLMTPRSVTITRENFEQYGMPESAIGTMLNIPSGTASPYRGTEGGGSPGGDASAPRGIRNNNPLNLEYRDNQGASGSDGRFGVYKTPEEGVAANTRQLLSYYNRDGLKTIGDIVNKWAPPGENDVGAYAGKVATLMGTKPNVPLNLNDPATMAHLVSSMGQVENGRGINPMVVSRGVQLAMAPPSAPGTAPGGLAPPVSREGPAQMPPTKGALPVGALPSSLPPGSEREFAGATDQYVQAQTAANSFKNRSFALEQASHALENADTGPGSETVNHIKSFLSAQSPESLKKYLPGVDPDKIQAYDEAVKYLAQYARSQPGAANSDMQSQLSQTANASTHISPAAAQQVVKNTLGLERMNQAALTEFNRTHPDGSGRLYPRWLTNEFLPSQDPRGYSWDDMSASQRASTLAQINSIKSDADRAATKQRLLNSTRTARQNGYVAGP